MTTTGTDVPENDHGLTVEQAAALARDLLDARDRAVPLPRTDGLTKPEATVVKAHLIDLMVRRGGPVVGYKVSMSRTWGVITADMVLPTGARVRRGDLIHPLVETELVMTPTVPLGPDATLEEVVAGTVVSAGIEIVDCRWAGWLPDEPDALVLPTPAQIEADNALSAWMVLTDERRPASELPLPDVHVTAHRDGAPVAGGSLTHVMDHPAEAVRWLLRELAAAGRTLEVGQFVSTGNPFSDFLTVPADGATYRCDVPGLDPCDVTFS